MSKAEVKVARRSLIYTKQMVTWCIIRIEINLHSSSCNLFVKGLDNFHE